MKQAVMPTPQPGPRRVLVWDLEQTLPALTADERYHAAMVIGRRAGVPCGSVDVDLDADGDRIAARLQSLNLDPTTQQPGPAQRPDVAVPSVSVVVPTIVSRTDDLGLLLDGLAAATYADVEILLVDNRPTVPHPDPLPALVARHPEVRVIRAAQPGISAARNAGIRAARHDIVAFTDDDVRVDAGWLRALAQRFADDPALDAVTGLILPAELETASQIWFERYYGGFGGRRNFAPVTLQAEETSGALRHTRATVRDAAGRPLRRFSIYGVGSYGAGANMAFRRSSLVRHGLFDTALGTGTPARGGEDLAMLIAILWSGGKIGYEPAAVVHHRHRQEWGQLLHQLQGNGLGFTAMLTSAVVADHRHLLSLATQVPVAARRLTAESIRRLAGRGPDKPDRSEIDDSYPRQLVLSELGGYPRGPRAYLRSRAVDRAWRGGDALRRRQPEHPHGPRPLTEGDDMPRPADFSTPHDHPAEAGPVSTLRGLGVRLREDGVLAWQQAIFCSIGGSPWLPRVARRLVFTFAGASVRSSPGIKFLFAGRARNLTLGRGVYMNREVFIEAIAPVSIGDDCALGMQALILTSHHPIDEQGHWGAQVGRPVTIGDRVWIGARATILPGAVIDSDVVIAAGAIVSGHARSHGVYAGVPARRIRETLRTADGSSSPAQ